MSHPSQVGVVVALPEEAKALGISAGIPSIHRLHATVMVCVCGSGEASAVEGARALVEAGCQSLVSFGTAAALCPTLRPGDWVLPKKLVTYEKTYGVDDAWRESITRRVSDTPLSGDCFGLDHVVGPEEKNDVYKRTGCLVGDMESAPIAKHCEALGLPFCVIRVVVDDSETKIPAIVTNALSSEGVVSKAKLIFGLITHPWQLPSLLRLAGQFARAKKTMTQVAKDLSPDFAFQGRVS